MDNWSDLPPLPEYVRTMIVGYNADQMRAYARAAVEAEREACENLCDNHQKMCKATGYPREAAVARKLAEMIQQRGKS